jgi:diacylglycerol kinase family enzyme
MSKTPASPSVPAAPSGAACGRSACARAGSRTRIALISNPRSTGNIAQLPRIRAYCDEHPDVFHYEVEHAHQVGDALRTIARIDPKVLVINGGDGTVQAALTELYNGGHFGDSPPPVAVLPSGKTNLIAFDLGAEGDPVDALERLIEIARTDLTPYIVPRELIALRHGTSDGKPVIGMFLGGAGLADTMLYCRHKIYPLGLPNAIAHTLTAIALFAKLLLKIKASFLPPDPQPLELSVRDEGSTISGRFALLAVTTLERVGLARDYDGSGRDGLLKLLAIEEHPVSLVRAFAAGVGGKLGRQNLRGVHFERANRITIHGESSDVVLDGETFRAEAGSPIHLQPAQPLSFVKLAA